jgi:hypothetical protein
VNGSLLGITDAEEADLPELPFDADEPVMSFSGPAEATATVVAALTTAAANGAAASVTTTTTTTNGLPVRRPQAQLPPKARRASSPPQPRPSEPSGEPVRDPEPAKPRIDRDPEHMAATMAAYARGLTGRGKSRPQ